VGRPASESPIILLAVGVLEIDTGRCGRGKRFAISSGMLGISVRLTDQGRDRAQRAIRECAYRSRAGSVEDYGDSVIRRISAREAAPQAIETAFSDILFRPTCGPTGRRSMPEGHVLYGLRNGKNDHAHGSLVVSGKRSSSLTRLSKTANHPSCRRRCISSSSGRRKHLRRRIDRRWVEFNVDVMVGGE